MFTSAEPIKKGESVKFGVKTDKVSTGINWKALDSKDKQIDTGKALPKELSGSDSKIQTTFKLKKIPIAVFLQNQHLE